MRLTELITPILDLVDAKKMPLATAVEVSYLDKQTQEYLSEFIRDNGMVKSYQVAAVRKYLDEYKSIPSVSCVLIVGSSCRQKKSIIRNH